VWRRIRLQIDQRRLGIGAATPWRGAARPARTWAGVLAWPALPYRLLCALLEVEPMSYVALRLMAGRAVYNFRGVM